MKKTKQLFKKVIFFCFIGSLLSCNVSFCSRPDITQTDQQMIDGALCLSGGAMAVMLGTVLNEVVSKDANIFFRIAPIIINSAGLLALTGGLVLFSKGMFQKLFGCSDKKEAT